MAVPIKFGTKEINDPEFTPKKQKTKAAKKQLSRIEKIKVDHQQSNSEAPKAPIFKR